MLQSKNEASVYQEALQLSSEHYENFPVTSFLFPRYLRKDVALVYRFARVADDIVDEGNNPPDIKQKRLSQFRDNFKNSLNGNYQNTFWELLHKTIEARNLNTQNFLNLLSAFEQDISKNEYKTFGELLAYCENSANPVGKIILELYGIKDDEVIMLSDKICTALQLTNFWQDVSVDMQKDRVYIPLEDFSKFKTEKSILFSEQNTGELRQIIKFEVDRTKKMFIEGAKIIEFLTGRLKWQIKWTINGGMKILGKMEKNNYDVLNYKPTLTKFDYIIALVNPLNINAK